MELGGRRVGTGVVHAPRRDVSGDEERVLPRDVGVAELVRRARPVALRLAAVQRGVAEAAVREVGRRQLRCGRRRKEHDDLRARAALPMLLEDVREGPQRVRAFW